MNFVPLPLLVANFPQMNFTQIHERLRLELLRRIQRGTLSVSLLARQTGFSQAHLSNFLHSRRPLSLQALDTVLTSQRLTIAELLPANQQAAARDPADESSGVPIVSHATALFEPFIRAAAVHSMLALPAGLLDTVRARVTTVRRSWQRFVAVRIEAADAQPMRPLVFPGAIAVIDRHYNSLQPYRPGAPSLYAVRHGAHLTLRYVEFFANRLALRTIDIACPLQLIEIDPGEEATDLIAGRVALILNET
jgi:hypothetical protein